MLPPIDISQYPEHVRFLEKSRRSGGSHEHSRCWICGSACKSSDPKYIHFDYFTALDPTGLDRAEMWCQPVGPECLRRHPELKPYVIK